MYLMFLAVTPEDHAQFTDNIMWAKGKTWISMRSATEPLFNTGCLETYAASMHRSINQWIQLLRKQSTGMFGQIYLGDQESELDG